MPTTSLLALGWLYTDTRDATQATDFSTSIFWFVLGGIPFFVVVALALHQGADDGVSFALAAAAGFVGVTLTRWLLSRVAQGA